MVKRKGIKTTTLDGKTLHRKLLIDHIPAPNNKTFLFIVYLF
jgi:hypothetical protein